MGRGFGSVELFGFWKLSSPLKSKILLRLALANKLLTWDNGKNRGWVGPGTCILCEIRNENVDHLFVVDLSQERLGKRLLKSTVEQYQMGKRVPG